MPKPKKVKIKKDGVTGECLASAVTAWERNGWTVVDDGNSETDSGNQTVTYVAEYGTE